MARDAEGRSPLQQAREAAGRGAWEEAFALFMSAQDAGLVATNDLPDLATVAYAAGRLDVTIEMWERAHRELLAAGDSLGAAGAAVRVAMHLLFDTALMAPVRGWLGRAEQLLDDGEATPAHAWFAVVRSYERMLSGELAAARTWAERAVVLGSGVDAAAAAIGRVAQARLVILDGDVEDGLVLLEEAGTAATSGDLDPLSTGVVYCELICALQGLAQYDLAEQWTEAMERWSHTNAIGSLHGRCRVHRAEILRLRGFCHDAEEQALLACDELRPYVRRELGWPLTELGRIRLRRGDVAGAEDALLAADEAGWDPEPGLSLVRLAQGDAVSAAAAIRDALTRPSHVPSKELPPTGELRQAPLLDAYVEIAIAAGDLEAARGAARAFEAVAERFRSRALLASATQARARVCSAAGDAAEAVQLFSDAMRVWTDIGAPYETAVARLGLAGALTAAGNEHAGARERQAAQVVLERIAAPTAVEEPPAKQRDMPNTFRLDGDYWTVVFEGKQVQVRDLKGMRYLARILAAPGREFHVLDLVAAEAGDGTESRHALGDAGDVLDAQAKDAYRRRLAEIDDDIEEAQRNRDELRVSQAQIERDFLVNELARAVGLGGRERRAGAASERARAAVTLSIRKAMSRLRAVHPQLGEHLDVTIRTGTYCAYVPDPRVPASWQV